MQEWDRDTCRNYEECAQYDQRYDELGTASNHNYSSDNKQASASFRKLAALRNVALRHSLHEYPDFKRIAFEHLDRLVAVNPLLAIEKDMDGELPDFVPVTIDIESNEFYAEACRGRTMFRTCLGSSPVSNESSGIQSGRIGEILDAMLSVTPLDFAVAGMHDRDAAGKASDAIVMTTEYIDPELDLVYDYDGNSWAFDGELHCVISQYNCWREIREIMMSRNGRVNKTHVLMFAAMRLATMLNAIEPLSVKDIEGHKCNVRGYLLAVLNGALPYIRMFKVLLSLIPPGGEYMSMSEVPPLNGISGLSIWVQSREYANTITVTTDGSNLKHLIIKAIIEGSKKLDTSRETRDELDRGFSMYGNNYLLINLFLSRIYAPDVTLTAKAYTELMKTKAFIALSLNSKHGLVRESLVLRNNGLKIGLDLLLLEGGFENLVKLIANVRGADRAKAHDDVKNILAMDEFGVSSDYEVDHLGDAALDVQVGDLYELQYPTASSITLRRRRRAVGKLWVSDGKFVFKKAGMGRLGLLTIFQSIKGLQVLGNGVSVDFRTTPPDATAIVNACLSNVFGFQAAVFVLEHILLGSVTITEGSAPGYLRQANVSAEGMRMTSFLHPVVTGRLAFYKSKADGAVYFDTKTTLGKQKVKASDQVALLENVEDKQIEYEKVAVSVGRKYLG